MTTACCLTPAGSASRGRWEFEAVPREGAEQGGATGGGGLTGRGLGRGAGPGPRGGVWRRLFSPRPRSPKLSWGCAAWRCERFADGRLLPELARSAERSCKRTSARVVVVGRCYVSAVLCGPGEKRRQIGGNLASSPRHYGLPGCAPRLRR